MAEGEPRRLGERVGWTAKVGGYSVAVGSLFLGSREGVLWGLGIGTGGLLLERGSNPEVKAKMKEKGTVWERAKVVFMPGMHRRK